MTAEAQELISDEAGLAYPIRDGIPIMLVDEARQLRDDEMTAQVCRRRDDRAPATPWPLELRLKRAEKRLEIDVRRRQDASACRPNICGSKAPRPRCRATAPARKTIVAGRAHVGIMELEPVGNYAMRIKFDDLHDTGIYSWDYLYQLGVEQERRWRDYLAALAAKGLSREPSRG